MAMKIIWSAVLFFVPCINRRAIREFTPAFSHGFAFFILKLIRQMQETQEDLIAPGARRYTVTSTVVMGLLCLIICGVVLFFCPLYLKISFLVGVIVCAFMLVGKITPDNRDMFDSFCSTYYKFVPDDELRTAMYNKKPSRMKLRLHDMELSTAFIPDFKKDRND